MLVLLGETCSGVFVHRLQSLGWGRLWSDRRPQPGSDEPWAFDNGAFGAWVRQEAFPVGRFEARLAACVNAPLKPPVFGVVPDMVAAGLRSLEFSLAWRDRLPDEWPWYLAVQDGMQLDDVTGLLDRFDGIFLGGSDRFKATGMLWAQLAHQFHKGFHYGRASTRRRVSHARRINADSLDTSQPLWSFDKFDRFVKDMATAPQDELRHLRIDDQAMATVAIKNCLGTDSGENRLRDQEGGQ